MALQTLPTLTPSGYAEFATAIVPFNYTTFSGVPATQPTAVATAIALPAGTAPDKILLQNLGADPAIVTIAAAAATTTGTAAAGSTTMTVASATGIVVGQVVVAVGVPAGTAALAISGTTVTLTQATTAALSSAAVNFITPAQVGSVNGISCIPQDPLVLAYVASGFICAICINSASRAILNVTVGV